MSLRKDQQRFLVSRYTFDENIIFLCFKQSKDSQGKENWQQSTKNKQ